MFIAIRAIIIVYVVICVIVAIAITIKKKRNPNLSVQSEIEFYLKAFFISLILSLAITPIVYGIYHLLQKKGHNETDRN
jgi:disulfide bond formation protein DsbB